MAAPALPDIPTNPTLPPFVTDARRLLLGDGQLLRNMADAAGGLAVNLAVALAIFLATMWAANWASQLTASGIARAHRRRPPDTTLQSFAASLVRYLVIVVGLIAVLQQLGVKATSVIAVLGAASLAIGLALQGALANVAAGVMLLVLRPYRVGDAVEVAGRQGTVRGLDLFATRLSSGDNLSVHVPNAKAFGDIIVNQSTPVARRESLDFVIDYEDDVDRALAILLACAAAEPGVSPKPEPWAGMTALGERGVTVTLRAWFAPKAYDTGRYDLLKRVKDALESQGFSFPYPQQVAVEARRFEPPRSRRSAKASGGKRAASPPPAVPGSTRGGSWAGR
ncbi:MAG TPA: mechanosensitive ion channel family protein [Phenylobacterium sp.]|uniref:mechanosensitive ion channel family protein n=1 Tax=Phenylobacterium sp. TaxID=1871053 RepID=UPI002CE5ED75|nr:mechanosensitive ion channel family protein [Phenylobacterium sp.]HXA38099.1 mechanosensitive ion channel family protein [Phenylobacterium sp.]